MTVKDPICGKDVDTLRARAVGIYGGVTYYFCSQECKGKYVDPRKSPRAAEVKPGTGTPTGTGTGTKSKAESKAETRTEAKTEATPARKDPSLEELPPMTAEAAGDDEPLPDLTPAQLRRTHSPSVMADVRGLKKGSRLWAFVIVILAALVLVAAVLSLRN